LLEFYLKFNSCHFWTSACGSCCCLILCIRVFTQIQLCEER